MTEQHDVWVYPHHLGDGIKQYPDWLPSSPSRFWLIVGIPSDWTRKHNPHWTSWWPWRIFFFADSSSLLTSSGGIPNRQPTGTGAGASEWWPKLHQPPEARIGASRPRFAIAVSGNKRLTGVLIRGQHEWFVSFKSPAKIRLEMNWAAASSSRISISSKLGASDVGRAWCFQSKHVLHLGLKHLLKWMT